VEPNVDFKPHQSDEINPGMKCLLRYLEAELKGLGALISHIIWKLNEE
jgi:hypothetical protein